jgi:hypothetical protein
MPDGAVRVTFRPPLTPEQYAELLDRVKGANSIADLRREMSKAARLWKRKLDFSVEP